MVTTSNSNRLSSWARRLQTMKYLRVGSPTLNSLTTLRSYPRRSHWRCRLLIAERRLHMERDPTFESPTTVARLSTKLYSSTSRRHAIAKLFRMSAGAVGLAVTAHTLSALTPPRVDAAISCGDPLLCGLCGVPCDRCGGTITSCPSGTFVFHHGWVTCCNIPGQGLMAVEYRDCCRSSSTAACTAGGCANNCPQPVWCGNTGWLYQCTLAIVIGPCGG